MRALVIGGSGQIGQAVAAALTRAGWQVTATTRAGRDLPGTLRGLGVQRADGADTAPLLAKGWDAVIDTLAFSAADAARLIAERGDVGAFVVISTGSVYADAMGRGFETDAGLGFPDYPATIAEDQSRVPPGPGYSAQKVAMEDALLAANLPLILLRPAAIHGPGARHPREWVVVKRLLDGRSYMPLAQNGETVFHTTSTAAMAGLTLHLLTTGQRGIFNVADPVALTTGALVQSVAAAMGRELRLVDATGTDLGHTPWSTPRPVVLSLEAALATGWQRPPAYGDTLPPYLDYLLAHRDDWQTAFPIFAQYDQPPFDYAAEDAVFSPAR